MPEYIYLESVNLHNVIGDTEDLSTRRAGGYMLLELVHRVAQAGAACKLKPITLGASVGLFELPSADSMRDALEVIHGVLREPLYAQATTIVVNTVDEKVNSAECQVVRGRLMAAVRRRQLQSLAVVTAFDGIPGSWSAPERPVCEIDGVRPAVAQVAFKEKGETRSQSHSVTLRREEGRALRQRFYDRELRHLDAGHRYASDDIFTDDLEELARFDPAWGRTGPPAMLEHKIAILYADGDGFGAVGRACPDWSSLRAWDEHVQKVRRQFLHELLRWLESHPHGLAPPIVRRGQKTPPRIRLETLKWGGDEFMIVVPAWLAMSAAQCFFRRCRIAWPEGERRTHSVGLVLAHHNAPISPLQDLAQGLAEQGKAGHQADQDTLNWIVLESFDHAGGDLEAYWSRKGMPTLTWSDMALSPARLDELLGRLPALAEELPRSSLYRIVGWLAVWSAKGPLAPDTLRLLGRAYANVHRSVGERREDWAALWEALQPKLDVNWPDELPTDFAKPEHLSAWLTLIELWDYAASTAILPPPTKADKESQVGVS